MPAVPAMIAMRTTKIVKPQTSHAVVSHGIHLQWSQPFSSLFDFRSCLQSSRSGSGSTGGN